MEGGDSEAIDVRRRIGDTTHGIEVKTIVNAGGDYSGKHAQLSMKKDQIDRKMAWRNEQGKKREVHAIALDHRDRAHDLDTGAFIGNKAAWSGHEIYYKRGLGKLRIGAMHKVKSITELKALMAMPFDQLPKAAQGKIR